MNTIDHLIAAALVGVGLGLVLTNLLIVPVVTLLVVLGDRIPDLDCHLGTHRKTLHNFLFPGVYAVSAVVVHVTALTAPPAFWAVAYVSAGYATHLLVDALGSRRGVALLYPISDQEYGSAGGVTVDDPRSTWASVTVAVLILSAVIPVTVVIG